MFNNLFNAVFGFLIIILTLACINSENKNTSETDTSTILISDSSNLQFDSIPESESPVLEKDTFLVYIFDPKEHDLKLYWKDENNIPFCSIQNLKTYLEAKNKTLVFAMNAGMYTPDNSPLGLFIENCKTLVPINKRSAPNANFYQKPNGIFYLDTSNIAAVCKTEDFIADKKVKYATQSGPMLLIDGQMHPICKPNGLSLYIRNGVGILPNNKVLFVLATKPLNFYDFANFFKQKGCKNALYLDGAISQAYLSEKNWTDLDGNFGPILGVSKKQTKN